MDAPQLRAAGSTGSGRRGKCERERQESHGAAVFVGAPACRGRQARQVRPAPTAPPPPPAPPWTTNEQHTARTPRRTPNDAQCKKGHYERGQKGRKEKRQRKEGAGDGQTHRRDEGSSKKIKPSNKRQNLDTVSPGAEAREAPTTAPTSIQRQPRSPASLSIQCAPLPPTHTRGGS